MSFVAKSRMGGRRLRRVPFVMCALTLVVLCVTRMHMAMANGLHCVLCFRGDGEGGARVSIV